MGDGTIACLGTRIQTISCEAVLKMRDGDVSRGLYIAFSPFSHNTD
jgi:hypothetical protein